MQRVMLKIRRIFQCSYCHVFEITVTIINGKRIIVAIKPTIEIVYTIFSAIYVLKNTNGKPNAIMHAKTLCLLWPFFTHTLYNSKREK